MPISFTVEKRGEIVTIIRPVIKKENKMDPSHLYNLFDEISDLISKDVKHIPPEHTKYKIVTGNEETQQTLQKALEDYRRPITYKIRPSMGEILASLGLATVGAYVVRLFGYGDASIPLSLVLLVGGIAYGRAKDLYNAWKHNRRVEAAKYLSIE